MTIHAETADLLKTSPVFGALDADLRLRLQRAGRVRRYPARSTIFSKGDPGDYMVCILSGRVRVCMVSPNGREISLGIFEPGQILGEIAALDGGERSADAVAVDKVEGLIVDRAAIMGVFRDCPEAMLGVFRVLCERVRRTNQQVETIGFRDLTGRLASLILTLSREHGVEGERGVTVRQRLAQKDLARMIACTRESVNRQLRAWAADGLVSYDKGVLTIHQPERLAELQD